MCASINDSPAPQAAPTVGTGEEGAREALKNTPLGTVVSRDGTGRARMVLGAAPSAPLKLEVNAETAARIHLSRHASLFGLHEAAVRDASVSVSRPLPGGASMVQFAQSVNGIEVFHSRATVVVDAAKNLVSASSTLHPEGGATHAVKAMKFSISPEQSQSNVHVAHFGQAFASGAVRIMQSTAKRVLVPEGDSLTPAYYIEFLARPVDTQVNEGYAYAVSANDGRVLYKASLTDHEAFKYRVWAEADQNNIPMDGPYQDYSPHPEGKPDGKLPGYRLPNDISMEGFNKNPEGKSDPWLPADATRTFGNNVRAYSDRSDTHEEDAGVPTGKGDGYDEGVDVVPDVTTPGTREFLRTFDVDKKPNENNEQIKAAVTDLFYVNNWMHDYWYDSGFNEAAGNAQALNFGRGGKEGDALRAEGQDGADFGQQNNANMTTFAEGTSPRMQMFVWNGVINRKITTTPALTFDDAFGAAQFGAQTFDVSADAVVANDGTAPTGDACQALTGLDGKIVVIDRGTCSFVDKVKNAQAAGAKAVLVVNNAAGHQVINPAGTDATITIPVLSVSLEDGKKVKDALAAGTVKLQLFRGAEVLHDGTIDNTVIAHEWGHYLHHRLVICGSTSCRGMSEGWADFNALMMVIREADTLEGKAFPMAQYAAAGLGANAGYFGIRRAPYSTLFTQNAFTFKHIAANSTAPTEAPLGSGGPMNEVHNVGEIWTQALFEGYVNLHAAGKVAGRTFQETKRRMADYIVAGMQITPIEPTFVEQRDAILSAVAATGRKDDLDALARGFAKRGFGVGAVAPPTASLTLNEVKESTATGGDLGFVAATIDDSGTSCDHDGILDSGENGSLKVTVRNTGFSALAAGTKVSATTTAEGITLGAEGTVDAIDALGDVSVSIPISAAPGRTARGHIPLTITVKNDAAAVNKTVTATADINDNYDDVEKASTTDDAESNKEAWSSADDTPRLKAWSRQGTVSAHVWHGDDLGLESDERLVSPDLVVGQDDLVLTFSHRYKFEEDTTPTFYDGSVLEVSKDGGATWEDVEHYVDPGYPHTILDEPTFGNALHGRKAFTGTSTGYPNYETKTLNFKKLLAGKTIKIRFRIGTDGAAGAAGWDIDDIKVTGITNLPFPAVTDNKVACGVDGGGGPGDGGTSDGGTGDGGVDPGTDAGTDSGTDAGTDSGTDAGTDSGTDAGTDSGTSADAGGGTDAGGSSDAGGSTDAGPQGVPPRYTNNDSSCAVSPALGQGALPRGAGVGVFAGLLMLLGLRRRVKA
ncbi:M36 family metallopeptidase [Pendulispora rubella]|uniref:M36 family metallopeptidase n=1 Tax=Pendulispora rubella TaxID=2741070 RepID=A0ABZ2LKH9_9BACT